MFEFVKDQPANDTIVVESYFATPPSMMFEAWTTPEIIKKWFGRKPNSLHSAEVDLREGGKWRFLKFDDGEKAEGFEGEYLQIDPDCKLVFSWHKVVIFHSGERELSATSRVEVSFIAMGSGTNVLLQQTEIQNDQDRTGFSGGWEIAFGSLSALFKTQ